MAKQNVRVEITANDKASAKLVALGNRVGSLGKKFSQTGATMTKFFTVPIAAGIGLAIKSAVDFETSFAGVRKTVDLTEDGFQRLSDGIRQMSREIPVGVNELNSIAEIAGQLGVTGVKNLEEFTETIAKIGVTTNLTEEEAATSFARIANIMQAPIDSVDNMASSVVDLGNNFATTEREIVDFATRIAGAGKIAGLTSEDIFAIGAAMSSVGVQAEAGGTAVQKVLIGINTAVATSNKDLKVFAKAAGMSAKEFRKAWRDKPIEVFEKFVEGLGSAGDDAIKVLEKLGLEDQRLIRSFLSLSNAGDLLGETIEKSGKAFKENNALTAEANKRFATAESRFKIARNRLNDVAITLGAKLLPPFTRFIEKIVEMIESFQQLDPALKSAIKVMALFASVLGPTLFIVGKLMSVIGGLSAAFGVLGGSAAAAGGAAGIGAMLGPLGWGLLAIGAAGALTFGLMKATQAFSDTGERAVTAGGKVNIYTQAVEAQKRAEQELAQAERDLKIAKEELNVQTEKQATAADRVRESEEKLREAIKLHGETSNEAKTATNNLEFAQKSLEDQMWARLEAELSVIETNKNLKLSEDELARSTASVAFWESEATAEAAKLADEWGNLGDKALTVSEPIKTFGGVVSNALNVGQLLEGTVDNLQRDVLQTSKLQAQVEGQQRRLQGGAGININRGGGSGVKLRVEPRAEGGPVSRGQPFIVGEEGPELFVPNSSGNIKNNKETMQRSNINLNVHVGNFIGTPQERRKLAETLFNDLNDIARRKGISLKEMMS